MGLEIKLLRTLQGHQAAVFALSPAPQPDHVLSGCGDGLVVSWPLGEGRQGRAEDSESLGVSVVSESSEGLGGSTPSPDTSPPSAPASATSLATSNSPSSSTPPALALASASSSSSSSAPASAPTPAPALALARLPANVFSLCWIPEQRQLLVGGMHGGVHVLDIERPGEGTTSARIGREIRNLGDGQWPVFSMLHLSTQHQLWMARGDGTLLIWDSRDWTLLQQIRLSTERLRHISLRPGGSAHSPSTQIALSCSDGRVYLLDAQSAETMQVLEGHLSSVFCTAWSPDGTRLFSGSRDARLRLWESDAQGRWQLDTVVPAHNFTINDLLMEPRGRWLFSASRDKSIKVWDAKTLKLLKVLEKPRHDAHTRSVNALHWHEPLQALISASDDRQIKVWQLEETGS